MFHPGQQSKMPTYGKRGTTVGRSPWDTPPSGTPYRTPRWHREQPTSSRELRNTTSWTFMFLRGRMKLVAKGLETRTKQLGGLIRSRKATRQDRGHVKRRHTPKDGTCREMAPAIRNQYYTSSSHTQGVPAYACMGFSKQGRHSKCQVMINTPRQETGPPGRQSLCRRTERHP